MAQPDTMSRKILIWVLFLLGVAVEIGGAALYLQRKGWGIAIGLAAGQIAAWLITKVRRFDRDERSDVLKWGIFAIFKAPFVLYSRRPAPGPAAAIPRPDHA